MRIFLSDVSSLTVRVDETNSDINVDKRKITEIYTINGIYECEKSKIRKLEFHDKPLEKVTFKGLNLLLDNTVIKYIDTVPNVDSNHYVVATERCELTLRRNARIKLVVEKINSKIKQIYFETNEDIENYAIAEDFSTLLSVVS